MLTDNKPMTDKANPLKASAQITEAKGKANIENLTRQMEGGGLAEGKTSALAEKPADDVLAEEPFNAEKNTKQDEIKLEELQPDTAYEKNGYEFKTDAQGRVALISGKLDLQEGIRTGEQTRIGKMGKEDDEGGHMIGARFNGPSDAFNLTPQNANLNRGAWKTMENEWANALEDKKEVNVVIEPLYEDNTIRPSSFGVAYDIDGEPFYKEFPNQSHKKEA